jgi:predicted secreted protein with PEFG-CTERM motif
MVLVTSFLASGMMTASAVQSNPRNPCTAANPCNQQICGDHVCIPGEYVKMQQSLAQAQIQSSIQNTTGMKYPPGIQNTSNMQNTTGIPNTSMQNTTSMMNTSNMQNTTSGVAESNQTVPEFGPITSLVLVIAIVSVVAVSAKTRVFLKL